MAEMDPKIAKAIAGMTKVHIKSVPESFHVIQEGEFYHCWIKYKTRCCYLVSFFFEENQSIVRRKLKLPEGVRLFDQDRINDKSVLSYNSS